MISYEQTAQKQPYVYIGRGYMTMAALPTEAEPIVICSDEKTL